MSRTPRCRAAGQAGVTLFELLGVLLLLALMLAVTVLDVGGMEAPLENGGKLLEGLLIQARARAVSSATAHRVRASSSTRLVVETADSCGAGSWTADPSMDIDLPADVQVTTTDWSICFSRRGLASDNVVITLQHDTLGSQQLEVLQGGVARWLE